MKETYEKLEMITICWETEDIITESTCVKDPGEPYGTELS